MPNYHFRCEEGHEFDKIINIEGGLYKWCSYCDRLTKWIEIEDPKSEYHRQRICSVCLGNKDILPIVSSAAAKETEQPSLTYPCPECGKLAIHTLAFDTYKRKGSPSTIADSSLRFHFDYFSETE